MIKQKVRLSIFTYWMQAIEIAFLHENGMKMAHKCSENLEKKERSSAVLFEKYGIQERKIEEKNCQKMVI